MHACMYVNMYVDYADAKKLEPKFYQELKEKGLALQYPFELDEFQQQAVGVLTYILFCMYVCVYVCVILKVLRLERGENVFVAAHTSAGKTVVAVCMYEYSR